MSLISIEKYPFNKYFAISFIDDTDGSTLENISPIYNLLLKLNIPITKTVWPYPASDISGTYRNLVLHGDTLLNSDYKRFCNDLQSDGFEIAMHTASAGNSLREKTIRAYDFFEDSFGHSPFTNIMHGRNLENIYWGKYLPSNPLISKVVSMIEPLEFSGHKEGSPYFWGDICKERTKYVRSFETMNINTIKYAPHLPFHDSKKPFVNWWFTATFGAGKRLFELLSKKNVDKLLQEKGASIIHIYCRHYSINSNNGGYLVHSEFKKCLEELSKIKTGWYVPVFKLLDRLRLINNLILTIKNNCLIIQNNSSEKIDDFSISGDINLDPNINGIPLIKNRNQFLIGTILGNTTTTVKFNRNIAIKEIKYNYSEILLIKEHFKRVCWQKLNGRSKLVFGDDPPYVKALKETHVY